ncbi:RNA polymerase factor sigma-32 [soil metagenome]
MAKTDVVSKKKTAARGGRKTSTSKKDDGAVRTVEAEVLDSSDVDAVDIENTRDAGGDYAAQVREASQDWESRGWMNRGDDAVDADDEPKYEDIKPLLRRSPDSGSKASDRAIATADPIAQYMAEVRRYPLLTREQEQALAVRYRETGDKRAAEALVTSNLRFVVKVAAEYSKFGARLIDLVQEGNVGLMHAVREFNPYKGVRLITYAVWWIRGYIQDYLMRQYSMVRIGTTQSQRKLFYRLQKEKDLIERQGEEPSTKLLSARLGVSEADVESMSQRMSGRDVSLQTAVDDSGRATLLDFEASNDIPIDEQMGNQEMLSLLHEGIQELKDSLNDREKELLEDRLLADDPLTLQEIGEKYGVTREAVRQMENRLMLKIRKILEERLHVR